MEKTKKKTVKRTKEEKEDLPLVNQCLGYEKKGVRCKKLLPQGVHFCRECKRIKNSSSFSWVEAHLFFYNEEEDRSENIFSDI